MALARLRTSNRLPLAASQKSFCPTISQRSPFIRLPPPQQLRHYATALPPGFPPRSQHHALFTPPPPPGGGGYKRFRGHEPFYASKRLWVFLGTGTVLFGGYYVSHLEVVPVTGRRRFMDVTPRQEEAMAREAYREVMLRYRHRILPSYHPYSRFVTKVAQRIVQVSGMRDLQWEFYVIDAPEPNAFVLPGGKVFVFTGILPIVQNEDGMAAVLGHEVAHQLARHSAEKLSFAKVIFAFQFTLALLGLDPSFFMNQLLINFVVSKPFSRKCESEADVIGLQLMAQACFDPREATELWKRMELAGKHNIPQFMSTHPSHKNRVELLEKEMPSALAKLASSDCTTQLRKYADMFNDTWVRW